jgi:hypothetical protein
VLPDGFRFVVPASSDTAGATCSPRCWEVVTPDAAESVHFGSAFASMSRRTPRPAPQANHRRLGRGLLQDELAWRQCSSNAPFARLGMLTAEPV